MDLILVLFLQLLHEAAHLFKHNSFYKKEIRQANPCDTQEFGGDKHRLSIRQCKREPMRERSKWGREMTKEECCACLKESREKTSCDCESKNRNQGKKKGFGPQLTKPVRKPVPKPVQELVFKWVITRNLTGFNGNRFPTLFSRWAGLGTG